MIVIKKDQVWYAPGVDRLYLIRSDNSHIGRAIPTILLLGEYSVEVHYIGEL